MVNIRPLNSELQEKAKEELSETPERTEADLKEFKEWIKKSAHLRGRTDDQFLIAFLRGTKFSFERAKEKYDLFFTLKQHIPELCRNRDPKDPRILGAIRQGVRLFLPNNTPDGPVYFLIRPGIQDTSKYTAQEILKINIMMMEVQMLENDNYVVSGHVSLMDFTGSTASHFVQMNPTFLKKMTMIQQDAFPIRKIGSHYVKMPQFALSVFALFKSLMNEESKSRMYVHGDDMKELFKIIPKSMLPSEYGGDAGSIESIIEANEKLLLSYRDYFLEDEKYGVDEKKRIGKPKSSETLFGVDGTFRQLSVD